MLGKSETGTTTEYNNNAAKAAQSYTEAIVNAFNAVGNIADRKVRSIQEQLRLSGYSEKQSIQSRLQLFALIHLRVHGVIPVKSLRWMKLHLFARIS